MHTICENISIAQEKLATSCGSGEALAVEFSLLQACICNYQQKKIVKDGKCRNRGCNKMSATGKEGFVWETGLPPLKCHLLQGKQMIYRLVLGR